MKSVAEFKLENGYYWYISYCPLYYEPGQGKYGTTGERYTGAHVVEINNNELFYTGQEFPEDEIEDEAEFIGPIKMPFKEKKNCHQYLPKVTLYDAR